MFLVHNDQSGVLQRGENGGAGADDHQGLAAGQPVPLVKTFAGGQAGVQQRHLITEAGIKMAFQLGGEGDFRHQHQH